jgi:hypothetical protein
MEILGSKQILDTMQNGAFYCNAQGKTVISAETFPGIAVL